MDFSILVLLRVYDGKTHSIATHVCGISCQQQFVFIQIYLFIWVFVCFFMFRNILCFPIKDEEGKSPFFFSWELYNGLLFVLLKYNILSCLITDVIGVAQLCNKTNGMLTKIRISLNVFWSNMNYHYEKILVWL